MASRTRLLPALCSLALLLFAGCSDMTLYRAGSDYFPLIQDTRWTYEETGITLIDSVSGDSSVAERGAVVVLRSFAPEFWVRDRGGAWRYVERSVIRGGNEYTLEARYALQYQFPFVLGATWSESFDTTVTVMGTETLYVRDSLAGRVAAVEDVTVPAGTFADCYRIEFFRSERVESLVEYQQIDWLAPGVGLVKRLVGADSAVLVDFRIGPQP